MINTFRIMVGSWNPTLWVVQKQTLLTVSLNHTYVKPKWIHISVTQQHLQKNITVSDVFL